MEAPQNFKEFYETELKQQLLPFEDLRNKVVRFGLFAFLFIILAFIFFAVASTTGQQWFLVLFFLSLIAGIVMAVICYNKRKDYISGFKENIVHSIIKFIDPSLQYNPYGHIHRNDYEQSGLYLKHPDRYNGDDYVEGRRDKTIFCFSKYSLIQIIQLFRFLIL